MQTAVLDYGPAVTFNSHPGHGQDQWVIRDVLRGKRGGYFVEAGAGPASNTQALEEHFGWTGLAVEPHPGLFEEMRWTRRCALENVCLTDAEAEVDFVINHNAPGTSAMRGAAAATWSAHYGAGAYGDVRVKAPDGGAVPARRAEADRIRRIDVEGAEWWS